MNADELGRLLDKVTPGEWSWERKRAAGTIRALTVAGTYNDVISAEEYDGSCWLEIENYADATLIALAPSLARRMIAAEKLVEAWFDDSLDLEEFGKMVAAYREASK